jgi:hypothetical protein
VTRKWISTVCISFDWLRVFYGMFRVMIQMSWCFNHQIAWILSSKLILISWVDVVLTYWICFIVCCLSYWGSFHLIIVFFVMIQFLFIFEGYKLVQSHHSDKIIYIYQMGWFIKLKTIKYYVCLSGTKNDREFQKKRKKIVCIKIFTTMRNLIKHF